MQNSPTATPRHPLPFREIGSYSLGAVGSNVIYALVATYLMVFYTESVGLKAAAVGTLLLVVRVWDGVMDVLMGILVDNTKSRWGKFRPYLLFGGTLTGIAATACFFSPNLSDAGKLVYAYCTYIMWSVSYTLCDIPFWSLTPAMTDDPAERTRIVSVSRTGAQVGYWLVYVGALPAVTFFGGSWALVGVLAGVICTVCFLIAFWNVREHCAVPRKEKQTLKSAFRFFIENRPLRYMMLACLLLETVSNIRGGFTFYFFKYYLGREDIVAYAMAANITLVIAGCLCAPFIASRIGKVNAALYSYVLVGIFTMLMYVGGKNIPAFLVLTAIAGFFDGVSNIARMSCLADCVEYGEWKTGNRAEGLVFSANIFKTKLASGLSAAIPLYLLARIGFVANTAPSESTMHWIGLFFTIILGAGAILAILPLLKYELHEGRYGEIVEQLNRRKVSIAEPPATDT
ncbi:MAG: glycoside-pentoside-hexuronide (GPH):cation symporter [Luteolibacter sp.]